MSFIWLCLPNFSSLKSKGPKKEVIFPDKAYKPKNSPLCSSGHILAISARLDACMGPTKSVAKRASIQNQVILVTKSNPKVDAVMHARLKIRDLSSPIYESIQPNARAPIPAVTLQAMAN